MSGRVLRLKGFVGVGLAGLAALGFGAALASGAMAASKKRFAEGVIVRYECGDNCYLTIKRDDGRELTGLCAAPGCAAWNDVAEMPKRFLGQRVRVVIGRGKQYDGAGNVMGTTTSFEQIGFTR
jgi:hypothetical protein